MKKSCFAILSIFLAVSAIAQKQTFDVVSYDLPKGWQQKQNEGGLQLSITDKKTGGYALAIITKATASTATADENFISDWNKLVKGTVQVDTEPAMLPPTTENGWNIISGAVNYTDGNNKGMATLLTATGEEQTVSVVLMTNAKKYESDLVALLNSLKLLKAPSNKISESNTQVKDEPGNNSIVGLWVNYTIETSGYYNGMPQPSGGYFRKEYAFYGDGTYLFRMKNWAVYVKDIQFVYESGTWKLNGNKLTITPKQGKGGWWNKSASNRTNEWGSLAKTGSWKMESVTYTVNLNYYIGGYERKITLQSTSATEREGRQDNNTIILNSRAKGESLIDNPPGVKTGFENKPFTDAATSKTVFK
ncbi:MAG TPA: hypothetical protein PK504_14075 [Ferruginibacter sp.]|nr:hypothetical protein [Ferruginibacter sp.]HRE64594.1 hypothetical protein [Ferruginibacter sp.]